jgi:hypothetical protein
MKEIESFCMRTSYRHWLTGAALLALSMSAQVVAEESQLVRLSQSVGYSEGPNADEQEQLLNRSPSSENQPLVRFGSRTETDTMRRGQAAHPMHNRFYRIYNAASDLSWDDDEDGFYHRLSVSFDADVDQGDAHVYAKLFLSFEGGPWNHYFTTDVFHILGEVGYDDYVVVTRLLDDYPSGYYDVLIELYDADWDEHVASYGPYEDKALSALPLEDQVSDYGNYSSESHGGGGGYGWLGLSLLALGRIFAGNRQARKVRRVEGIVK